MQCAIYCRLSKEDEERQGVSESIQNQKSLLLNYATERGWDVFDLYCDEDYSGADRHRPAFRRMLVDAEAGRFQVVLCKTQSRFTRDMELVEKYIHGKFPLWGIRFVAVVDNVDTAVRGNKKARQINGLINEWYLEDLSENIRTVFDHKRRSGQYIGAFPLYGYQKDPGDKNRLVVDRAAAQTVRRIFTLFLAGNGKQHIARLLNQDGVPNPTRYKQLQGWGYVNGGQRDPLGLWNRTSVGRILHERMYTGDLVQGRRRRASYKSKSLVTLPEEAWIVVPNTHEALVDRETFDAVQRLLGERTKSSGLGQAHPLAGKVRCMDCGSAMVKVSTTYQGVRRSYLRCKQYAADPSRCTGHSVRLDALEAQVLALLLGHLERYYDRTAGAALLSGGEVQGRRNALERELATLTQEVARRSKALRTLYLDRTQGLLDEAQFQELNRDYLAERNALQARLEGLEDCLGHLDVENGDHLTQLDDWLVPDQLPRDLVAALLDSVEVGTWDGEADCQPIRVNWLF